MSFQECYNQALALLDRNSMEEDENVKQESDLEVEALLKKASQSSDNVLSGEALLLLGICYSSVLFLVKSRRTYNGDDDSSFTLNVPIRDKIWRDALDCLERSSSLGNSKALFNLAIIYNNGECGVLKNLEKSNSYMQKCAESGLPDAQYAWGGILFSQSQEDSLLNEDLKAKLQKESLSFYLKAAFQKHPRAQCVSAVFLMNGIGCSLDGGADDEEKRFKEGLNLFKESAASGLPDAQFALARILENGECGEEKDVVRAQYWYDRAEHGGNEK